MKYSSRYETARSIAKKVGDEVASRHFEILEVDYKDSSSVDPVTNLDKFAQKSIIHMITESFPKDVFFAEEDDQNSTSLDSEDLWIIDPIDGTANFMHGLPLWGVSIAFASKGKLIFGIVYCPEISCLYEGYTENGAFLNDKQIKVSVIDKLGESIITSGLTHGLHIKEENEDERFDLFVSLLKLSQRVRILGTSVLQICEVASGHSEGFCGTKLKPWDFAASAVILREAGGMITDFQGKELTLNTQDFICSNGLIHNSLLDLCKFSDT
jgi:myo-inositol-1(or 4)-monophosphatase